MYAVDKSQKGIEIDEVNSKMDSLSFVMINESQSVILDYLQKSDLNVEKAANLYLNGQPLQFLPSSLITRNQIVHHIFTTKST